MCEDVKSFIIFSKFVRNVPFRTSIAIFLLNKLGCCFCGRMFFQVPAGAQPCIPVSGTRPRGSDLPPDRCEDDWRNFSKSGAAKQSYPNLLKTYVPQGAERRPGGRFHVRTLWREVPLPRDGKVFKKQHATAVGEPLDRTDEEGNRVNHERVFSHPACAT